MLTLGLCAMDSRYATEGEIAAAQVDPLLLPPDFHLMAHQAQTIAALRFGDEPIVINTARTGDGKSFTALYPALALGWKTMTFYPTNELVKDQDRSLKELKERWRQPSVWNALPSVITAAEVDVIERAMDKGRTDALLKLLDDLVLTNPDIFHLMMQFRYRTRGASTDLVVGRIANIYRLFTFDEFHIFGAPENASAIIAMLLLEAIRGETHPTKFLFLSATPQHQLTHMAKLAGLPFKLIKGDYQHGNPEPPTGYRRILQPVDLHLYERGDALEAWVDANIDRIIEFFEANRPAAYGVIIANSIATAYRVHQRLIKPCHEAGINLGEPNTGLTPPDARRIDAELFVATSTVDLGVDFKINFLVFESLDVATHMQRLGRLGRHKTDRNENEFRHYEAHALLPGWVIESLQKALPDGGEVDRSTYNDRIHEAYPLPQDFSDYRHRWGSVQAGRVMVSLAAKEIQHTYALTRTKLEARLNAPFPNHVKRLLRIEREMPLVMDEASTFRGSSPFMALVSNTLSSNAPIMSYNLIALLRNGDLETLDLETAYRRAGEAAATLKKTQPLAAYRLNGWLPKPRNLSFSLDAETRDWGGERFETVIEQDGFSIQVEGSLVPEINALNRSLQQRTLVALLVRNADTEMLRRRYRLGMQIELFNFSTYDGSSFGCAAFGRDALLLDSLVYRDKRLTRAANQDAPLFG